MIRVLIVDDHELLRAGLRSRLEREPGIAVVGEADTAERAVLLAGRLQPDLVVLDDDGSVDDVMARGRWHVLARRPVIRGALEERKEVG